MIFVTGGTGLLGSHLLVELIKDTTRIRATYRSDNKRQQVLQLFKYYFNDDLLAEERFNSIEWVRLDILDVPGLLEAMPEEADVYHCAALVSFQSSDFIRMMKINREGTANIVNVCLEKKARKLCYVSSTAAIGGDDKNPITEDTKWKKTPTTTGYSISKYSAEKEVWRGIEEGLNAVMVNPCVILGAGNWNDSSLTIFNVVSAARKHFPPGANAIVDARDVSQIMVTLMNSEITAERFLCIGSNQTIRTLINEIAEQLQVKKPTKEASKWLVETVRRVIWFLHLFKKGKPTLTKENVDSVFGHREYDSSKIQKAIGFEFTPLKKVVANGISGRLK